MKFRFNLLVITVVFFGMHAPCHAAAKLPEVRVGVLVSGSVNWHISTLKNYGFDKQQGINVVPVPLGSVNALSVALQGGSVDFVISDWVWVAKQHQQQRYFNFYPYSTSLGGLVVRRDSGIDSLNDLVAKRIGVAGGPEGKSWLLLTAYAKQQFKIDLANQNTVKFVTPPLVNALLARGELDVGLNYWHFNSVLDSNRYKELLNGKQLLRAFKTTTEVPMLGWVFNRDWANKNEDMVNKFLRASNRASQEIKQSNSAWTQIEQLLSEQQKASSIMLRDTFRQGIPLEFNQTSIDDIEKIFTVLEKSKMTDPKDSATKSLPREIFWQLPLASQSLDDHLNAPAD